MKLRILFMALLALGICFAGLSVDQFTVTKDSFKPGEPGVVTVSVSNPAGAERVTSITMTINSPPELLVTSAPQMADIDAGGSAIVSIPFRVKEDAKPGIYLMNVIFQGYKSEGGGGQSAATTNIVSIPVTVVNTPILSVSSDKQSIGGIDQVILTITNNGGKASNIRIRMPSASEALSVSAASSTTNGSGSTGSMSIGTSSSLIALYGVDQIFVPSIGSGESTPVKMTLDSRSATDGPTDVHFLMDYGDEIGASHSDDIVLRMTVRNEKLDLSFIQQSEIITKRDSTLTLSIRNDGPEELKDVRLSFTDTSVRIKDSGELKFGDLAPGQTATASVASFVELPPGVNQVACEVSWIEKDVQKEEAKQIPLTITSDADVGVYLEAKPLPLTIGSDHTISVLVSNLGSYSIQNVDVRIESPALRSLDISDRQYIGGLQTDDFSTVQFQMRANASVEGNYPVKVIVSYRDQSGEMIQREVSQDISVYSPAASSDNPLPLILIVLALAVAVWHFKFRRKAAA
ncbi:MAG: hypothetical protein V1827_03260 [Candidatus Micrarchaeota archaeon]